MTINGQAVTLDAAGNFTTTLTLKPGVTLVRAVATDAEGNDSVNAFYQRLGWKRETSYVTSQGRRMNRYVLDF